MRLFLPALTGFFLVLCLSGGVPAGTDPSPAPVYDFAIDLDGDTVGRHTIAFEKKGDELHVRININIEVSFGPITFFRYEHENHEVWKDGKLVRLHTQTYDDGRTFEVSATAGPDGLKVNGAEGTFTAPPDILPTSYWRADTPGANRLLGTQKGRILNVTTQAQGRDVIPAPAGQINATRYKMSGDLRLRLWYGPGRELLNIAFDAKGREVSYAVNSVNEEKAQEAARYGQ